MNTACEEWAPVRSRPADRGVRRQLLALPVVFGLGTGNVTPSTTAMIGDLATNGNYGSARGVFGSLWDAGHASGPLVFGFLLVALGCRTSWLIMALVMATALIVFLAGTRHQSSTAKTDGTPA